MKEAENGTMQPRENVLLGWSDINIASCNLANVLRNGYGPASVDSIGMGAVRAENDASRLRLWTSVQDTAVLIHLHREHAHNVP